MDLSQAIFKRSSQTTQKTLVIIVHYLKPTEDYSISHKIQVGTSLIEALYKSSSLKISCCFQVFRL